MNKCDRCKLNGEEGCMSFLKCEDYDMFVDNELDTDNPCERCIIYDANGKCEFTLCPLNNIEKCEVKKLEPVKKDMVNHPAHYKTKKGLETIDVIEAFTEGLNGIEATDTGNIIKYACRWKKKNGIEDLKKIRWYVNHLINYLESK